MNDHTHEIIDLVSKSLAHRLPQTDSMDREINPQFRRKQLARRWLFSLIAASAIVATFLWGSDLIRPSINRARIRTAKVDAGPIEATISASGTVVPELEQVLSSPINARVVKVLKKPGDILK